MDGVTSEKINYLKELDIELAKFNVLKHEIQYEISLEDFTATQYINGEPITKIDYLKDLGSKEKALEFLKQEMEYGDFGEFVSIDDNDLKKALGLERDDDGNIYDPLAKIWIMMVCQIDTIMTLETVTTLKLLMM